MLIDRIGRRTWTDDDVVKYMGRFSSCWLTYATDATLRERSSSGGSTTAILIHQLRSGAIDGAMVVQGWVDEDGRPRASFEIARTEEQLRAAQGSKYQAVRFGKRELAQIAEFPGRLGFVLLPCDATKLAAARLRDPAIDARVALVIALFCGHNTEPALAEGVAKRLAPDNSKLTSWHYRSGHWRGVLKVGYQDGTEVVAHHNEFKNLHNLYFFAQQKCNHCFDHFGYDCDLSVGDIWTLAMRQHPVKHTAVVSRTPHAEAVMTRALEDEAVVATPTDVRDILDGQSRTLPFHYNVSARAKVGRLFGLKIEDRVSEPVGVVDLIVAFIILLNQRITQTRFGRAAVLRAPRPLVRLYLMGLKFLEQL